MEHYDNIRPLSSIGYVAPRAKLERREEAIFVERNRKLEKVGKRRRVNRQRARFRDGGERQVSKPPVGALATGLYELTRRRHFSIPR